MIRTLHRTVPPLLATAMKNIRIYLIVGLAFCITPSYAASLGTWSATGSMATARAGHTATLLPSGQVLVVGGYDGSTSTASAELYDPATGVWSFTTEPMSIPRYDHTATLLPNGQRFRASCLF